MSAAEMEGTHLSCSEKEIDEYLHGTIYETVPDEEDLDDIEAPEDDEYDVDIEEEAEGFEDEYIDKAL